MKAYKRTCIICNSEYFSSERMCRSCRGLDPVPAHIKDNSHNNFRKNDNEEKWNNFLNDLEDNNYYPEAIADALLEYLERKRDEIEESKDADQYDMEKINQIINTIYTYLGDKIWLNLSDKELLK